MEKGKSERATIVSDELRWLDVIDEALCWLATLSDEEYTDQVEETHGRVQAVLAGVMPLETLAEVAVVDGEEQGK